LHLILGHKPAHDALPLFVREIEDIRGVRVIRLQGPVGMEIGEEAKATDEAAAKAEGVFMRPLLFDFKDATDVDFSTVGYMVQALHRRMSAHAKVGIINPPPHLIAELEIAKINSLFRFFETEK